MKGGSERENTDDKEQKQIKINAEETMRKRKK